MSLKATPRGLLAAIAAIGIVMLSLPAAAGGTVHAAAPATHAAVQARIAPHIIAPHSITPITETVNGISLFPLQGPAGELATISFAATPAVTNALVIFTDSAGVTTTLYNTTVPSGAVSLTVTIPSGAAAGSGSLAVTIGAGATQTLVYVVNARTITTSSTTLTSLGTATRGTAVTLGIDNYPPGVPITPTLVYSNASTAGYSATALGIFIPDATGLVTPSVTFALPANVAYGSTATISVEGTQPVTPTGGFPTIAINAAPTFTVTPAAVGAVGISQTLSLSSTDNGGFNITPGSTITFEIGLQNQPAAAIAPTAIVTSSTTGTFTATLQFTPTVAGTYVITASDAGLNNQATATFQAAVPAAPVATSYLAEGYTGGAGTLAYHELLSMLNPNPTSVIVTDTYLLEVGASSGLTTTTTTAPDVVVVTHTIGQFSVATVDVASDIASQPVSSGPDAGHTVSGSNQKVATIIRTAGFTNQSAVRGVAVERLMERLNGTTFADGDALLATTNANTSYYFAEGYTGVTFQEYLILFNPSPTVTATVNVVRAPSDTSVTLAPLGPFVLAPYQRVTLNLRALNVGAPPAIGLIVNSDKPVVAERTMYFGSGNGSAKPGMTNTNGLTTAAKQLNFAYGSLTGGFDIANPITGTIVPTSDLQQTIDDRPFLTVMNPNIAGQVVAGTTSGTATAPGPSAHVTVQLRGEDGRLLGFFISDVDAGARFTLSDADLTGSSGGIGFPGVPRAAPTRAGVFSAVVSSSERVVAELANYYGQGPNTSTGDANLGAPGLATVGAPSGETDVVFPMLRATEPVFGRAISSTVFLYNPGVNPISVMGAFYTITGTISQSYTINPDQIQVIGQSSTDSGGTGAAAGSPMPVGTLGAEFSVVQTRGTAVGLSGEPGQADESFVAAAISHSGDANQWWGTQGYYPLPTACSTATGCP